MPCGLSLTLETEWGLSLCENKDSHLGVRVVAEQWGAGSGGAKRQIMLASQCFGEQGLSPAQKLLSKELNDQLTEQGPPFDTHCPNVICLSLRESRWKCI